jgi:hypothetical protein
VGHVTGVTGAVVLLDDTPCRATAWQDALCCQKHKCHLAATRLIFFQHQLSATTAQEVTCCHHVLVAAQWRARSSQRPPCRMPRHASKQQAALLPACTPALLSLVASASCSQAVSSRIITQSRALPRHGVTASRASATLHAAWVDRSTHTAQYSASAAQAALRNGKPLQKGLIFCS